MLGPKLKDKFKFLKGKEPLRQERRMSEIEN